MLADQEARAGVWTMAMLNYIFVQIIFDELADLLFVSGRTWYEACLPARFVINISQDFEIFHKSGFVIGRE